ncbi:hypothetical protein Tco_0548053 [Tanacetum coccineum]
MPPTMTNRSAGRPAAASRGWGTGVRAGRGGGRTRGRSGDQGDRRVNGQGGQVGGQGSEVNDGVNGVPDFSTIIAHQLQNLLPTIVAQVGDQGRGQGNGRNQNGDAVNDNIRVMLVEIESVHDMSGCRDSQRVKYSAGSFVGKALTWWDSEIRTRGREAAVGMSWEDFKTLTREEFCPSNEMQKLVHHLVTLEAGTLTDEALRNGSIKKNPEKRGNVREPSKDRNGRGDNKRTRTGNDFATTANPVRGGYTGTAPKDYRMVPRNVNPINARNPVARTCFECGSIDLIKGQGYGNQGNQARGRAFVLGAEEDRQDPNIVTEPSDLGFSYEIEITSRQLVEIDNVIRGCKLEIEAFLRSSSKHNLSSSSNLLPSCALVKKNMISEFAEALTPL